LSKTLSTQTIIYMHTSSVKSPSGDWTTGTTLTVTEAADVLRIGRSAAYEAVRAGQIPSLRIGRRVLVPVSALKALLDGASR
jgi:excisionase family DNA binding protein